MTTDDNAQASLREVNHDPKQRYLVVEQSRQGCDPHIASDPSPG
jgi:hypothetical protein